MDQTALDRGLPKPGPISEAANSQQLQGSAIVALLSEAIPECALAGLSGTMPALAQK